MINHNNKYILIHIPKNAGSSMEISLGGYEKEHHLWGLEDGVPLQHLTAHRLKHRINSTTGTTSIFDNYFKFTFVRNPFSKCVSEYFWVKNHPGLGETLDFKAWVRTKLRKLIEEEINKTSTQPDIKMHNLEQYRFIYSPAGEVMVDYIGRFENLQQDFNIICDKIGIPQRQLPHECKAGHKDYKHYTEYYDDETREIVAKCYAKDIEYFGYSFQ